MNAACRQYKRWSFIRLDDKYITHLKDDVLRMFPFLLETYGFSNSKENNLFNNVIISKT